MRIHAREDNVRRARWTIDEAISKAIKEEDLTTGEIIKVVTEVLTGKLVWIANLAIRQERHGNTNTPGGVE